MTRFKGMAVMAGLILGASAANAQMLAPYRGVSDFDGPYERPYGAMPPAPPPVYNYGGYGQPLLPLPEVYAVLRDNGFSPLGIPHQRGLVYVIAAIDRRGEDGRLVIDARTGRILRFMPAYGYGYGAPTPYGENFGPEQMSARRPDDAVPPPTVIRADPRPPAPVPHVASRAVPMPAPKPQQSAIEAKPATSPVPAASAPPSAPVTSQASASPPPAAIVGEAKPAPAIRPTQQMPAAQGLD